MNKPSKDVRMNIRVDEDLRDDFHIASKLRGSSAAAMLRQFIVQLVREEKKLQSPEKWAEMRARMAEMDNEEAQSAVLADGRVLQLPVRFEEPSGHE